jgi:exodeoxyribonuclease V alpha subunit
VSEQSENRDNSSLTNHKIKGEIKRVVFESEDGNCTVLRVIDDRDKEHTVVGPIPGAHEGQGIEVTGAWVKHKEHGLQMKADSYKYILPSSPEGIKRYLGSGLIHGIGPKLAECIVDRFGTDTLNILDNYSSRLTEIPGFGKKRLEMVKKAWSEHAKERDVFIYLQSLGISLAYCRRIYKKYGERAPAYIKENPFRLAEEIDGIGFIMADKVAGMQGISGNDSRRLTAGVVFTLNRLAEAGHVCYPVQDFIEYTADLLNVETDDASAGLNFALSKGLIFIEKLQDNSNFSEMVYKKSLYIAEKELAYMLGKMYHIKNHACTKTASIPPPETTKFSDEQLNAVNAVAKHALSVITGGPGVGKTTVVSEIVRRAREADLKVYLAAPTGRAAKRMSETCRRAAMTIHRLLKWEPEKKTFVYNSKRPLKCDLLIVDEVSMLDIQLALFLFRAVGPNTTVVLVGDSDQLPSVGPGTVLMDIILSGAAHVTHLSKIFRQGAGSKIISNAHEVNAGRLPDLRPVEKNRFSDFYWIEQDDPEKVVDIISRMVIERIPQRFNFDPMRDIQILSPMNRGSCGTRLLNEQLQNVLNPHNPKKPYIQYGDKVFRSGDRVMQIRNNYDKLVFNGDMGRIIFIDTKNKIFRVKFEERVVEYDYVESDQIVLAYSITVHKSQGSEFSVVIFPILTQHYIMLQRNLLYTGMTRAKKLLILLGSRKALSMAVNNIKLEPRFSMLKERTAQMILNLNA